MIGKALRGYNIDNDSQTTITTLNMREIRDRL